MKLCIDKMQFIVYISTGVEATHTDADVAQSVERRLGKAEVTGSIPVISLLEPLMIQGFFIFIISSCMKSFFYVDVF